MTKKTKNKQAAKTKAAKIKRILTLLAECQSVDTACGACGVEARTWYRWLGQDEELRQKYARAKELMAEAMADEIMEIADDKSGDLLQGKDGPYGNRAAVDRSRLRVDARKWLMSKLLPKKYGDKLDVSAEKGAFNLTLRYDKEDENA